LSLSSYYFSVKGENNKRRNNAIVVTITTVKINRRKTMKKFQMSLKVGGALVMALASLFAPPAGPSVQGKMKNSGAAAPAFGAVIVVTGRVKHQCTGFGICHIYIESLTASGRQARAQFSANADGKLTVVFLDKPAEEGPTLFIDEDITAPPAVAKELGFKSVTLLKGEYAYNSRRSVINARLVK
jgi:hypothetical protein